MSFGKRFIQFCNDNIVAIAGTAIIIGVHWGWYKLQDVPTLVDPSEKKELPIIIGAKYLGNLTLEKVHHLTGSNVTEPPLDE